jgi:hypothetical protein
MNTHRPAQSSSTSEARPRGISADMPSLCHGRRQRDRNRRCTGLSLRSISEVPSLRRIAAITGRVGGG